MSRNYSKFYRHCQDFEKVFVILDVLVEYYIKLIQPFHLLIFDDQYELIETRLDLKEIEISSYV